MEKWHPSIAIVNRSVNLFNDNVTDHFRNILRTRQQQTILDRFLTIGTSSIESPAFSSDAKIQKRERTPERQLSEISMEGDSSSKQ